MFAVDITTAIATLRDQTILPALDDATQSPLVLTMGAISVLSLLAMLTSILSALNANTRYRRLSRACDDHTMLLDRFGIVLVEIDRHGVWQRLSAAWLAVTGYSCDRSIGQTASHNLHPDDKSRFETFLTNSFAHKQSLSTETFRFVRPDGSIRIIQIQMTPIADDHDTVTRLGGTLKDVTKEQQQHTAHTENLKALREKSALLEIALENINQGIMMVDADGRVTVVNQRAIELLGLPPEIAETPMKIDQILRYQWSTGEFGHSGEYLEPWLRKLMESRQHILDMPTYERRRPNGCMLEIQTKTLKAGGAVRTFSDITHRKRIELDLAHARDLAEAASRMRSEFLAIMSNEIRSPLNGILGLIAILAATDLDREQDEHLANLRESGEKLLETINDVLDFAKLDADLLTLDNAPFDPATLCETVIGFLAPKARQKKLEIGLYVSPDVPTCVIGDSMRLRQILMKLVSNAIKFTHTGGVMIEVTAKPGNQPLERDLRFSVRDTGIGVPQNALTSLFQEFFQFDRTAHHQFSGIGLGLAICKKLVDLMRGTIYVESTEMKGSVFHVSLTTRLGQDTISPKQSAVTLDHATILLIDNNPISQKYISQPLIDLDADLEITPSISQATKYISTSNEDNAPFNAIILNMEESIDSFIESINLEKIKSKLFIFVLYDDKLIKPSIEVNEFLSINYIKKPLSIKKLIKTIESILPHTMIKGQKPLPAIGDGRRVLLAEDDATNQLITSTMLHQLGFAVDCAQNGMAVLAALKQRPYDLIVMDVMMPQMDGLETTKTIRAMATPIRHIPILALTANAFSHDAAQCLKVGMDDFASKPITRHQLESQIKALLETERPALAAPADTASVPSERTAPPSFDPTKIDQLIRDIGPDATDAILASFQLETQKRLDLFKAIIQSRDYNRLAREAHSLKSSAATIGFMALSREAARLERALMTADAPDLTSLQDRLVALFQDGSAQSDAHRQGVADGDAAS